MCDTERERECMREREREREPEKEKEFYIFIALLFFSFNERYVPYDREIGIKITSKFLRIHSVLFDASVSTIDRC